MAKESSFDIVSTVDMQEVDNAFQQARKELAQRYDLKDSGAEISLDKSAGCHDDLAVISRHIPWLRCHIGIYRCCRLDTLAKRDNSLRGAKCHCLNDIMAGFCTVWYNRKTNFFKNIGSKNCTF